MKMTYKTTGISVLLLWVSALAIGPWYMAQASAGDYTQDFRALEHRIGEMEITMKEVAGMVTESAEGTTGFYREMGASIKRISARMDSLERRMSEWEMGREEREGLRSRLAGMEAQMQELETGRTVAKEQDTDTNGPAGRAVRGRRTGRWTGYTERARISGRDGERRMPTSSRSVVNIFVFHFHSQRAGTEIRYYTVRDISVEDIRLPDYMVRGLGRVRR